MSNSIIKRLFGGQASKYRIFLMLRFIPDAPMLRLLYRFRMGRRLDLAHPVRFTEKLQWLKLHYRNLTVRQCVNKLEVREYVRSKGYEDILTELYATFDHAEQVSLNGLPDRFVVKTTNGSGTNLFCLDRDSFNLADARKTLAVWMSRDRYIGGRDWSDKNATQKIIVEEFLEDEVDQPGGVYEYMFMCFHGRAKYVALDIDKSVNYRRNFYDIDWNYIDVVSNRPQIGDSVAKPTGLHKMIEVAEGLSDGLPFARVDLYWVGDRVRFGEMTLWPWGGFVTFVPDEFDYELGALLDLSGFHETQ